MLHGDATFGIPDGDQMAEFSYRLADEPDRAQGRGARRGRRARSRAPSGCSRHGGLDGFALCADYCFNTGPVPQPRRSSPSSSRPTWPA